MEWLFLLGGIVLGVVFDEFFSKIFKRGKAKVEEVVENARD